MKLSLRTRIILLFHNEPEDEILVLMIKLVPQALLREEALELQIIDFE